jgi:hypothetical protein
MKWFCGRGLLNGYPSAIGAQRVKFDIDRVLPGFSVYGLHDGFVGKRIPKANVADTVNIDGF